MQLCLKIDLGHFPNHSVIVVSSESLVFQSFSLNIQNKIYLLLCMGVKLDAAFKVRTQIEDV